MSFLVRVLVDHQTLDVYFLSHAVGNTILCCCASVHQRGVLWVQKDREAKRIAQLDAEAANDVLEEDEVARQTMSMTLGVQKAQIVVLRNQAFMETDNLVAHVNELKRQHAARNAPPPSEVIKPQEIRPAAEVVRSKVQEQKTQQRAEVRCGRVGLAMFFFHWTG